MDSFLGPGAVLAALFLATGYTIYTFIKASHLERMAKIEKGIDTNASPNHAKFLGLKIGMLMIGIACGILLAYTVEQITTIKGEVFYPSFTKGAGNKTTNKVPEKNEIVHVDLNELKKTVGNYVFEQFTMMITLNNGVLFAQPKGSDKEVLKPKGSNKFFIEELGAEIEFTNDGNKQYLILILEGNVMKGVRK